MGGKKRVLFLCTGNACRSQMAEGWLRALAGDRLVALSAGTEPAGLHPRAVASMAAAGIDISGQRSKSVTEFLSDPPDLVVTVCDRASESCPVFPGTTQRLHWSFPDPAAARGSEEEVRAAFDRVRDQIGLRLREWWAAGAPPLGCDQAASRRSTSV